MDSVDGVLMKSSNKASMDDIVIKKKCFKNIRHEWANICHIYNVIPSLFHHWAYMAYCSCWNVFCMECFVAYYVCDAIYFHRYICRPPPEWVTPFKCHIYNAHTEPMLSWATRRRRMRFTKMRLLWKGVQVYSPQKESKYNWTELTFSIELVSSLMMKNGNWTQSHLWLQSKK